MSSWPILIVLKDVYLITIILWRVARTHKIAKHTSKKIFEARLKVRRCPSM
jgi:hypothetical protein